MSIFTGTYLENDIERTATGNRLPDDMYDDANYLMNRMQDLRPIEMIAWIMKVGYTENEAIELFESELGGRVFDTEYSISWLGYKERSAYTEGSIAWDNDHHYCVIEHGEYKWEATFETYIEAMVYIGEVTGVGKTKNFNGESRRETK